jgi:DNA/RNA-binding domain of Phe-tRNA-synthetase-like protein
LAAPELSAAVDAAVFERHPDYAAAILVADGLVNGPSDAERHLLARGLARAADAPQIACWRAAFSAFGAKPSRYPCSAEALAARVLRGDSLPRVNRLVDHYNAVSVRHLVPVGGEDLDRLHGVLRLTIADGTERYDAAEGPEHPEAGEIVWRDEIGVTCRRWNWRQGTRTRLTDGSTRVFFVFDRLGGLPMAELDAATGELEDVLRRTPGCRVDRIVLAP